MEISLVSAISIKHFPPSNLRCQSTLSISNICNDTLKCCSSTSLKHLNNIPAAAVKIEANMRYSPIRPSLLSSSQPCRARTSSLCSSQLCKATTDDSGRMFTGESILSNEETLERELQIAIDQENYAEAARIRDRIRVLHEDSEAAVLAANARFYNAFRTGDLSSMQALWAKHDKVCCVHPGASGICGYEFVMRSWEYVWIDYDFPLDIQLKDIRVHVTGDIGYVTCMEMVKTKGNSWGKQFATNVFERVDGHWLICIHHASPIDL